MMKYFLLLLLLLLPIRTVSQESRTATAKAAQDTVATTKDTSYISRTVTTKNATYITRTSITKGVTHFSRTVITKDEHVSETMPWTRHVIRAKNICVAGDTVFYILEDTYFPQNRTTFDGYGIVGGKEIICSYPPDYGLPTTENAKNAQEALSVFKSIGAYRRESITEESSMEDLQDDKEDPYSFIMGHAARIRAEQAKKAKKPKS